ncbi:hypothetical protein F3Y22_tig00014370pilonHSYRG00070 [Hibiscus syriacus]|uniref:Bifunctional inhibitor/plant lipid transfer protein/seed storage helical domain-containing protein n=1 Tax=Hibiscus syriacus TaxID=106335 RepID=A0A6A3C4H4_HIBSY|nr:hypothetical protein F3Y22_tig00014370pilonHSYRG00070 [Hibiscus syriacus]
MAFKASVTTVLLSLTLVLFTLVSAQSPPPPSCPTTNLTVCLFQPNNPGCCSILAGLGINARVCLCSVLRNLSIAGINIGSLLPFSVLNAIVNVTLGNCNIQVLPGSC